MASKRVEQIAAHLNFPKGMLAGQVAIVTGSGQGIGAETARLFANEGAKVVISDIDAAKAKKVADDINASGGQAVAIPGDMLDDKYLTELVKKTADFGNGKINIIVNNAGYTWDGVIHKTTDKQWDTIIALHNTQPFKLVRAASPYFRVKDGAPRSIVNISSTSGLHGNAGQANYALAKAGVTGLTKTIAKEWGPAFGVRANTVAFGFIMTRLTAAKEEGAFVTTPDGEKVALGIPQAQKAAREDGDAAFKDIPLGRPGTATEAASAILAVVSPLFSLVRRRAFHVCVNTISTAITPRTTVNTMEELPTTLIDLLSNAIVLRQTAPYIPIASLLALSATCRTFRDIITTQKDVWRYLDLTETAQIDTSPIDVGGVTWRTERMDESLTEDDFYAGPLRGICSHLHQRSILSFVQTLVLDGLSVPADLVREIVTEDRYNVRVLSIREAKHLNVSILQQVLRYIVRPTRAAGTPKLKALYFFGPKDAARYMIGQQQRLEGSQALGVMASEGAQIGAEWNQRSSDTLSTSLGDEETKWYNATGRALRKPQSDWPDTLVACLGLICFDAVLCRGPRHDITKVQSREFLQPTLATVALGPAGCEICHTCPEGPTVFGCSTASASPLLGPVPTHASNVRAAQYPHRRCKDGSMPKLILRCEDCLRGRWCERCNRWWCENCYEEPVSRAHLRTELQQIEAREDMQRNGWNGTAPGQPVKVYSKLCVEHCLVSEMMSGAGSNGMWG
ncbi:hypothetical protein LTR35_003079 [Friedmanniomyces endolithicus]|uniref:3-oxoacyl-[acyl-carrier-protein] reductase n=1 Tax=Friedmanniomyces endolithicus TaxID=329885 RepID=A0AAN6J7Y3_9PEZI|nr:hypothetical protein LTR35_003079 [Friedmanniomyces endolithicus]KAK0300449.1 hypothetical protein LTS00_000704 [Friedmanniomyces endolithicus]KAK0312227.1 hypothetical protein LTR82_014023 [Friedmanniomyces endolithicus]KAK0998926.1 hypothetical protein LTR54_009366 [Friedmanniomyces endolithicus]